MIKTILVPIDGSSHAAKALELASDIAGKYEARLRLVYILPDGPLPEGLKHMAEVEYASGGSPAAISVPEGRFPASMRPGSNDDEELGRKVGEGLLERAAKDARRAGVGDVSTDLETGDPAERILEHAEKEGANLIVMGTRGLGSLKGLLMGSVSQKVSQLAPCSCIMVR